MDVEKLNKNFIEAVKKQLPAGNNMAKVIMDVLYLGKEAVYRRLRGDVPFTFAEIVRLSRELSISIDNIAGTLSPDSILFELETGETTNLKDADYSMLTNMLEILKLIKNEPEAEMVYSSNMFPQFIFTRYYNLSKFHSFKWVYQQNWNKHGLDPFHLMDYPDELQELKVNLLRELKFIKNITYIWDNMVFLSVANDIKYFYSIDLLRKEDVLKLKEELLFLVNDMEQVAVKGTFGTGNKVSVYVSDTNIDATYNYIKSKNHYISMIGVFAMNYITSTDEGTLEKMKLWTQSQKKVSTLISESGEVQRMMFFKKQREIIEAII